MPKEWLSTSEAGEELGGLSDDTIRRLIAERRLAASLIYGRPGRPPTIRIRREELDRFKSRYVRNSLTHDWER